MGQLSEKTVNHGDLEAYHDELMQSEVMPRTNKGIGNEAYLNALLQHWMHFHQVKRNK